MSDASLNEQLLTALFDGELQGEERELAERLLGEHPEYQDLANQWKEQAAAIKKMPNFQLDDGFAFRVMREVLAPKISPAEEKASFGKTWQIGFAAIASLAALLLLTVFVFPNIGTDDPVALKSEPDESTAAGEIETRTDENLSQERPQPPIISKRPGIPEQATNDAIVGGPDSGAGQAMAVVPETDGDGRLLNLRSRRNNPPANAQGVPGRRPSVESFGGGKMDQQVAGEDREQTSNNVNSNQSGDEPEPAALASSSAPANQPDDSPPGDNSNSVTESQLDSPVGQVLVVEIASSGPPNATVEEVFARHAITIVGANAQSESNKETLYNVVSTPTQMKQAMIELSFRANISGYQLPSTNELLQLVKGKQKGAGNNTRSAIIAGDAPPKIAAAQQLQSFRLEVRNNARAGDSNSGRSPNAAADEIAQLDQWFGLTTQTDQDELTQYLLFVRPHSDSSKSVPSKTVPRSRRPKIEQMNQ